MLMIAIGLLTLALVNGQHLRALKTLRANCPGLPASVAGSTAVLIMLLARIAFGMSLV